MRRDQRAVALPAEPARPRDRQRAPSRIVRSAGPLAAALLAVLLTGSAAATTAERAAAQDTADERLTWGAVPADEDGADERVSFRLDLEPGAEHRDFVEVSNFSDRAVTFALTASDGVIVESGEFDLLPQDEEPVGSGAWISLQDEVTVGARSSEVVPYTLTVPEDALPGDHPGGIAVSVQTTGADEHGNEVAVDARVGVRVHLRVAGEVTPRVEVTDVEAEYRTSWNPFSPGTVELSWEVANTGNVRLGSSQDVEVSGPFGVGTDASGEQVAEQREILPGQRSTRQSFSGEAWPWGRLSAVISAEQNVVGEDVIEAAVRDARAEVSIVAVPWAQLTLLGSVVLVALLVWWRRRRQRRTVAAAVERARAEGASSAVASPAVPPAADAAGPGRVAAPTGGAEGALTKRSAEKRATGSAPSEVPSATPGA